MDKKGSTMTLSSHPMEGKQFFTNQKYHISLNSYTKALEYDPDNKKVLVARAHCNLKLGLNEAALEDAEKVLQKEPTNIWAMYMKANTLYSMGNFEHALIYFHRGFNMRSDIEGFRLGIQKAQQAIDNSIGKKAGVRLEERHSLIPPQRLIKRRASIKCPHADDSLTSGRSTESTLAEKTARQLLGPLAFDKEFFTKIAESKSLCGKDNNKKIVRLAQEAVAYLQMRQDFWHQQKPLYTRRREKVPWVRRPLFAAWKQRALAAEQSELERTERAASRAAESRTNELARSVLADVDAALRRGQYKLALRWCRHLQRLLSAPAASDLPDRAFFAATLHGYLGAAYLELRDFDSALAHFEKNLHIAQKNNISQAVSRALDNIGKVHALTGSYSRAIKTWQAKLPLCQSPLEAAWINHEIGRCFLEMSKSDQARSFGEKSLEEAEAAFDYHWQLNARLLIAQSYLLDDNKEAALQEFRSALGLAKALKQPEAGARLANVIKSLGGTVDDLEEEEEAGQEETQGEE